MPPGMPLNNRNYTHIHLGADEANNGLRLIFEAQPAHLIPQGLTADTQSLNPGANLIRAGYTPAMHQLPIDNHAGR